MTQAPTQSSRVAGDLPVYHRVGDDRAAIEEIRRTGILIGHPPRHIYQSDIPAVKAYVGGLPDGKQGFEFTTDVAPDRNTPPYLACWRGPRPGVVVRDDTARIRCTVLRAGHDH